MIDFYIQTNIFKSCDNLYDGLIRKCQKLGILLLNNLFKEKPKFVILMMNVVLLIWYSKKKNRSFRRIKLIFDLKKLTLNTVKGPIFGNTPSKDLTRFQRISLGCSFEWKNNWISPETMKFHNYLQNFMFFNITLTTGRRATPKIKSFLQNFWC